MNICLIKSQVKNLQSLARPDNLLIGRLLLSGGGGRSLALRDFGVILMLPNMELSILLQY